MEIAVVLVLSLLLPSHLQFLFLAYVSHFEKKKWRLMRPPFFFVFFLCNTTNVDFEICQHTLTSVMLSIWNISGIFDMQDISGVDPIPVFM
jgi:hypothetical protein